jgi:putative toxin-antitoxin system antitoxin component (TIGR02293 family)
MTEKQNAGTYSYNAQISKIRELNERYALTIGDIAGVLDVAPKTLTRWAKNKTQAKLISQQKTDSLDILNSILKLGKKVLGSDDELNRWLHSSVFALGGKKPIDLIKTESGRRKVETALHQIEYGIF